MSEWMYWAIGGAIAYGLLVLLTPRRSELWGYVEDWGKDNRMAAQTREGCRSERKMFKRQDVMR